MVSSRRGRYFHVVLTQKIFFSFGKQVFEDQIRRLGIRTVPQNITSRATFGPPVRHPCPGVLRFFS